MAQKTGISWTDVTWNPVTGCDKVSPGCAHCYAETFAERWRGIPGHAYEQGFDLRLWPSRLDVPLRWRRPRMVFVNSMSDLFHEEIPDEYICRVFTVMRRAEQHTFQVLTKRPERMRDVMQRLAWRSPTTMEREDRNADPLRRSGMQAYLGEPGSRPLPNVWLGVSIENRKWVGRADVLRETPAAVRFISAEPLLGPLIELDLTGIDWLIVGGESGPGHRPMRLEWARDLRDACMAMCPLCASGDICGDCAGVRRPAYFLKQTGGARPGTQLEDLPEDLRIREFPRAEYAKTLRGGRAG